MLRNAEEADISQIIQWWNDPEYMGEFQDTTEMSDEQIRNLYKCEDGSARFIIEKNSKRIGHISAWKSFAGMEIGFAIIPDERGKGYGTDAIMLMIDYLFDNTDVERIQARPRVRNVISRRVLENAGFSLEGIMRKGMFIRGEHRDMTLYSIIRDD